VSAAPLALRERTRSDRTERRLGVRLDRGSAAPEHARCRLSMSLTVPVDYRAAPAMEAATI
jgi:hypothetical protein